ncbi:Acetyl esterase/lipase [Planctomycetales bacterium 10988]|nr:Acetyl esterase/lipase [Planctomycetales bacterium 10988]
MKTNLQTILSMVILALLSAATLAAEPVRKPRIPSDLNIIESIVFKEVGDTKLDLMFFQPTVKKFEAAPLVVYIHGGGWGKGDKYKAFRPDIIGVIRELNRHGIACASIEYRLADGGDSTAYDSVADCKDALRYLAAHANEYKLDPALFAVMGSSAGAHLALVTALGDDQDFPVEINHKQAGPPVRCAAAYYGLVSFVHPELLKGSNFERPQRMLPILGGLLEDKRELAEKMSPLLLLDKNSPPLFLAHGDNDVVLSHRNSLAMRDAAIKLGVPVECVISKGAKHGFGRKKIDPPISEINRRTVDFFVKYLVDQPAQ